MIIVGIDEAGRGCWAGPLVAAAVILRTPIEGLADSKQLTRRQREKLDDQIRRSAIYGLGWVEPAVVDELGLTEATSQAMAAALAAVTDPYDEIIIDGYINYLPAVTGARQLVKADSLIPAVSAASILAKVARDRYMCEIAAQYPLHGFDRHVGYGTAHHLAMLQRHGVTPIHRSSYKPIKQFLTVKS